MGEMKSAGPSLGCLSKAKSRYVSDDLDLAGRVTKLPSISHADPRSVQMAWMFGRWSTWLQSGRKVQHVKQDEFGPACGVAWRKYKLVPKVFGDAIRFGPVYR